MERAFARPTVVISSCIEHDFCNWNEDITQNKLIKELSNYVSFLPVCPQCEIGLNSPDEKLKLILQNKLLSLVHETSRIDYTSEMLNYISTFLHKLNKVDGFILKHASPVCGIKNVKIYSSLKKKSPLSSKGRGLFAEKIMNSYKDLPVIDDEKIKQEKNKRHFLTSLFIIAEYRTLMESKDINKLIRFQEANRLLYLLYNQTITKQLERLVANYKCMKTEEFFDKYYRLLKKMFLKHPTTTSSLNSISFIEKMLFNEISRDQVKRIHTMKIKLKNREISLDESIYTLAKLVDTTKNIDLQKQTFFSPYPHSLLDLSNITTTLELGAIPG